MSELIVTDHALLRYLERVLELPIEAIRAQIAATPGLAAAAAAGSAEVSIDGFTYSIKGRKYLTTIAPGRTPAAGKRRGRRHATGQTMRGGRNDALRHHERDGGRGDRDFDRGGD